MNTVAVRESVPFTISGKISFGNCVITVNRSFLIAEIRPYPLEVSNLHRCLKLMAVTVFVSVALL